jgi:hypothetical protein
MPGGYTADEQAAAKLAGAIADSPSELKVGVVTKATSSTTAVVTHGLSGTPDFVIASLQTDAGSTPLNAPAQTANSTSVTFTISTAQTNWSVAYIMGYTA